MRWWNEMLASEYSSIWAGSSSLAVRRQRAAQGRDLLVARMRAGKPRRHALERRPDGDHLEDLVERLALDEHAAPRLDLDEPLLLEAGQRLADRGARDPELLRHLALVEAQIRPFVIDVHRRDAVLQHVVNMLFQAEIAADRLELELGALGRLRLGRSQGRAARHGPWYTTEVNARAEKAVGNGQ